MASGKFFTPTDPFRRLNRPSIEELGRTSCHSTILPLKVSLLATLRLRRATADYSLAELHLLGENVLKLGVFIERDVLDALTD
jgi:hypothetical protein